MAKEFERDMAKESDIERLSKAERIKKNVKKIKEENRKAKEVAKPEERLPKKKKKATKAATVF